MKKYDRQRIILSLIEDKVVETQEELTELLLQQGVRATQATISRDIKELRITKIQTDEGIYKYTVIDAMRDTLNERLSKIFKSAVLSFETNENRIYVNTISYAATVTAQAINIKKIEGIAAILSGHDTIFIDVKKDYDVNKVLNELKDMIV